MRTFCLQAELAAQLLEEEWPDEDEVRAARMAVREEATPVPERAWALRNVASTLALGGPGERARARSLLEKAVTLKEQWLDDKEHPGLVVKKSVLYLHAYAAITGTCKGRGEGAREESLLVMGLLYKANFRTASTDWQAAEGSGPAL